MIYVLDLIQYPALPPQAWILIGLGGGLLLLIWFVRWFYHTFIEGGL